MTLSLGEFSQFFQEVHGYEPFPWQRNLLERVAEQGQWPAVLDLPTGSGKTAAIDVAVFHLALEADRGPQRLAPVRIAFVVDRRLVVDDAFGRAQALAGALASPGGPVSARVAKRLLSLSGDESKHGRPLIARRLRGGIPREDDWARTPSQPTVLCSTVDQIGSRLLFRGYGVSDSMKPVHAGLIGSDCVILLDEAHLAEPFRQTLRWVARYRGEDWRETKDASPWGVALLTATPGADGKSDFALEAIDKRHPVLKKRLEAAKPARLVVMEGEEPARAGAIAAEVRRALAHFKDPARGASAPAIGVVVNRVARARAAFSRLKEEFAGELQASAMEAVLLIGPCRARERDEQAGALQPIRTKIWNEGENRSLDKPLLVIATQCIEAGVDIDLDALITEVAALDALRQRFGRLNRAGRNIVSYAAVLAAKPDLSPKNADPVYGQSIRHTWDCLTKAATKKKKESTIDFGLSAFGAAATLETLSPKPDAPVLMPAHLDLLSQTWPVPAADPEVALYLHGPDRQPDSVSVLWRGDIEPTRATEDDAQRIRRLLTVVPPRSMEAIELPLWAVRRWLEDGGAADTLADVAAAAPDEERAPARGRRRQVFLWKGNDELSRWIEPRAIRSGDSIVVPGRYGGVDEFGWNPQYRAPASDVAREAAMPFRGRRFALRIAPGLFDASLDEVLADALARVEARKWLDVRDALLDVPLPEEIRADLVALDEANRRGSVTAYLDIYGTTVDGRPRGVVFVAPFGIRNASAEEEGTPNSTEDDLSGSLLGRPLTLAQHSRDVEQKAEQFARGAGLPGERMQDLRVAGFLHDLGKADPRFQRWLHHGDPLGPDPDEPDEVLAKSGRPLPPGARARSGLPEKWRHEAFSVRLASGAARFADAADPELVLWLVGVHHGYGRPFFPHADALDAEARDLPAVDGLPRIVPPGHGPQSLAFDWKGIDWATLFERLKARYGIWGLAHMEAILRLADHRASEDAREGEP